MDGRSVVYTLEEALEGVMSLLRPGPYGVADDDPKALLIRDFGAFAGVLKIAPVIIGDIAVIVNGHRRQTSDVDLLVSRHEALNLIRKLEASQGFSKIRIDRFRHNTTGAGLDLCVEGEITSPRHKDRFPSPAAVEKLPVSPIAVVGLTDLLALKVKSARSQDETDFIRLYRERRLTREDVEHVREKVLDPALREMLTRWHARALEEMERDCLMRPPDLT